MLFVVLFISLSAIGSSYAQYAASPSTNSSDAVPSNSCGTMGPYAAMVWLAPKGAVNSGQTAGVGMIMFRQDSAGQPTTVKGQISGLTPNMMFGLHVHQVGNLTDGCDSTKKHYNPQNVTHGDLSNPKRHAGDLGNIQSDASGVANINLTSDKLQLVGPWSVIGRGLVLHAKTDDLGLGGNADSLASGNSDGRMSCGIIGQANEM